MHTFIVVLSHPKDKLHGLKWTLKTPARTRIHAFARRMSQFYDALSRTLPFFVPKFRMHMHLQGVEARVLFILVYK